MNINTSIDDVRSSINCSLSNCSTVGAFEELCADLFNALSRCPRVKKTMRRVLISGIHACALAIIKKEKS